MKIFEFHLAHYTGANWTQIGQWMNLVVAPNQEEACKVVGYPENLKDGDYHSGGKLSIREVTGEELSRISWPGYSGTETGGYDARKDLESPVAVRLLEYKAGPYYSGKFNFDLRTF